jgi:hypothetical protein
MPTPLIYNGLLYVLANNGTFDAYNLKTGAEIYQAASAARRQRLQRFARSLQTERSTCRMKTARYSSYKPGKNSITSRRIRWANCDGHPPRYRMV